MLHKEREDDESKNMFHQMLNATTTPNNYLRYGTPKHHYIEVQFQRLIKLPNKMCLAFNWMDIESKSLYRCNTH